MADSINPSSRFGCCSRFLECSDAKRCIVTDESFSVLCTYRENLENNRIFYGKNANDFMHDRYNALLEAISFLSDGAKSFFESIVLELCEHKRNSISLIIRNRFIDELASLRLFEICKLNSMFPYLCYKNALKQKIKEDSHYAPIWKIAERNNQIAKKTGQISKNSNTSYVDEWLNTQGVEIRDRLAEPYRYLSVIAGERCYIECYYRDYLIESKKPHLYMVSPLAEDGWVPNFESSNQQNTSDTEVLEEPLESNNLTFDNLIYDVRKSDDVKRLIAAKDIKAKYIADLDLLAKTAVIRGSSPEPYEVSLSSCTCMDFSIHRKPCKHIFRLAMELGMECPLPEFDNKKAKQFDMQSLVETLCEHWINGEITSEAYAACLSALEKSASKAK